MRVLRYAVLLMLLGPYLEHLRRLDQYVVDVVHRPLHFLGMSVFAGIFYLFMYPEERKVSEGWKKKYGWLTYVVFGSSASLMIALWAFELLTGHKAGHIVAIVIYGTPIFVVWMLTVLRVIDRPTD